MPIDGDDGFFPTSGNDLKRSSQFQSEVSCLCSILCSVKFCARRYCVAHSKHRILSKFCWDTKTWLCFRIRISIYILMVETSLHNPESILFFTDIPVQLLASSRASKLSMKSMGSRIPVTSSIIYLIHIQLKRGPNQQKLFK
ncbi:hypothetical protein H5410_045469 [Solanum commersonii]|uniref:Uncharacterized protein n=1 Tax=Solanum commersonii TaxID=4109 RepID=A0A9J5X9P4_SOLCO|nr:hypothetical protein H5410_045469 [Solanum commersonii]